jgi:hypothetical protein
MKKTLLITCILIVSGCAGRYHIERHHNTFLRRMPQLNRIETGRIVKKGSFSGILSGSYSLREPRVLKVSDSSFESRSSLFGDELTIITSSNGYCYESRYMASGEGVYGFSDEISAGVSLDVSGGKINLSPSLAGLTVKNNDIEGSVFVKFAKQFGRLGVSIKPELTGVHMYGDKLWTEIDTGVIQHTVSEKLDFYTYSIRSSSIIRYEIFNGFFPFAAFQIKTQPFLLENDNVGMDIFFGIYGGIDYQFRSFAISPFIAVPLGSSMTHYKSPVSAGLQLSVILNPKEITKR